MSDITTRGVRVRVRSVYVPEKSSPADKYYFFAYTVRITNEGSLTVQLLSRKWIISGPEGEVSGAEGRGVVGETPVLQPGHSFEYTSFCTLETPFGSMCGTYHMVLPTGEGFDVAIAPFALATPGALN